MSRGADTRAVAARAIGCVIGDGISLSEALPVNLESLDDRTKIDPPKGRPEVIRRQTSGGYAQPDKANYPHAPGCLRVCYATVAFRNKGPRLPLNMLRMILCRGS